MTTTSTNAPATVTPITPTVAAAPTPPPRKKRRVLMIAGPLGDASQVLQAQEGRRRRARREHRERNPTLAETGGLPPPRPDGCPPAAL